MLHSIHELAEDMRRQVKRHREKRRRGRARSPRARIGRLPRGRDRLSARRPGRSGAP